MEDSRIVRLNYIKWALADLIVDLTINAEVFREYVGRSDFDISSDRGHALVRMVCSSLVVNLSKLSEVLKHFGGEVNELSEPLRSQCVDLRREIEKRKIYQFRSKYVAHLIDKTTKQPLSISEGDRRVDEIIGSSIGDLNDFCEWVCPAVVGSDAESVVSIICSFRDHCRRIVGDGSSRP